MSLLSTGIGKITGALSVTDKALMRWDGVTGELAQSSMATLDDAGKLTAVKFQGDGSLLTNLPGGAGTGDVVGPLSSVDFIVPTFDGITGRLLRQSDISINGNIIKNKNDGQDILFASNLGGKFQVDNDVKLTKSLTVDGLTTVNNIVKINYGSDPAIEVKSSVGTVGLRLRQGVINQSTIMDFRDHQGARKGWFGYGSSIDRNGMFLNNDWGNITITPKDASGLVTMTGFTKLGDTINHPGFKVKLLKGTTSSSSTGNISITHGLDSAKIIAVFGSINHSGTSGVPISYEGAVNFDSNIWWDAFNVKVINSGSSITSKPVNLFVMYIE